MGRPNVFRNPKDIHVVVEKEELDEFNTIRLREGRGIAEMGRKAFLEYVRNHKAGNSTFPLEKWQEDPNFQVMPTIYARKEVWIQHFKDLKISERKELLARLNELRKLCVTSGPLK
jgi:hypothetical protein